MPGNSHRLPKTAYDHLDGMMPGLMRYVRQRAPEFADRHVGMTMDDLDGPAKEFLIRKLLVDYARENLARMGHRTSHWSDEEVLGAIPPDVAETQFSAFQQHYIFNLNFEAFGKKTYFFREPLCELLADTELNVQSVDFTLPFPACMFVYDNQFARDALFATSKQAAPTSGPVSAYVVGFVSDGPGVVISAMLMNSAGRIPFGIRRQLRLAPGTTIEDALRTEWGAGIPGNDEQFFGPGLAFIRMVVNSALYLTAADPDVSELLHPARADSLKSMPKRQRINAENAIRSRSAISYVDVGQSIERVADPEMPTVDDAGRKLDYRVKVRSHWKTQRFGAGRAEAKRIQIMPYWRGPDAAEVIHRPFIVRGPRPSVDEPEPDTGGLTP